MIYIATGQIDYEGQTILGVFVDDHAAALQRCRDKSYIYVDEDGDGPRYSRHWIHHWEPGASRGAKMADLIEDGEIVS